MYINENLKKILKKFTNYSKLLNICIVKIRKIQDKIYGKNPFYVIHKKIVKSEVILKKANWIITKANCKSKNKLCYDFSKKEVIFIIIKE